MNDLLSVLYMWGSDMLTFTQIKILSLYFTTVFTTQIYQISTDVQKVCVFQKGIVKKFIKTIGYLNCELPLYI